MEENKGFKMKGASLYGKLNLNRGGYKNMPDGREKSSALQKHTQEHEGNETMGSEQLEEKWGIKGLSSSTDYYINRGEKGEPMILGEVELEDGDVTGVPGEDGGKLTRESDKPKK